MLYHPEGIYVWDTWYFERDGQANVIHLQIPRPGGDAEACGALGHAVSTDLIRWQTLPTALYPNAPGTYDDLELWTGSVGEKEGLLYLFYTARSSREGGTVNRIALATSTDGIHWQRHPENPVITPDPRWYIGEKGLPGTRCHGYPIVDCRDLCVVKDPDGEGYYGFYAARRPADTCAESSVIALCHSLDLVHWNHHPPCFAPNRFACIEVPDVFSLHGKWYMCCLTGNMYGQRGLTSDPLVNRATIYAVADRLQGPYVLPADHNVVIGSVHDEGYSGKTLAWQGERVLFYTQSEWRDGCPHGSISLPVLLDADANHRLLAKWHPAIQAAYEPSALGEALDVSGGEWGSKARWIGADTLACEHDWAIVPFANKHQHCLLEADITLRSARAAGLCLRLADDHVSDGGVVALLDAEAGQVVLTQLRLFPAIEARTLPLDRDKSYHVRIIATGNVLMVYVDDLLQIQCYVPGACHGRPALFVERGQAVFRHVTVKEEKEHINV
jgi:beta-fructofuranosidase